MAATFLSFAGAPRLLTFPVECGPLTAGKLLLVTLTDDALDFPRYVPFPRVGLTSFSLPVGDEGQGTTLFLTTARPPAPPARSHALGLTTMLNAREENGFAFHQRLHYRDVLLN